MPLLLALLLADGASASDDTPPPPATSGIGRSPTAEPTRAEGGVFATANVTEVPPWLRGDVSLNYSYDRLGGHLTEDIPEEVDAVETADLEVGQRTLTDHVLSIDAIFSAGPGVAITLGFPIHVRESTWFGTSQTMVYDPTTGSGTMQGTNAVDIGAVAAGAGLEGVWIGLAGTPFSEAFEKRQNRATWRLAGALRTPNKHNFYTVDAGKRGVGSGGLGLRIDNAFSTTVGVTQPYLSFRYESEGKATVNVTDNSGSVISSKTELQGPKSADIRFGAEFLATRNAEADTDVRIDLHGVISYASWSLVPSGIYLPSVLNVTDGAAVQNAESADIGGGLGVSVQAIRYLRIGLFGQIQYHLRQRIESPYPIYTSGDTIRSLAGANMTIRVR